MSNNTDLSYKLEKFFKNIDNPKVNRKDLVHAAYSLAECHMFPDYIDSISPEQIIFCWKIIEKLRHERFPENLVL